MAGDVPANTRITASLPRKCANLQFGMLRCLLLALLNMLWLLQGSLSAQEEKPYLYAAVVSVDDPSGSEENAGAGAYLSGLEAPTWQPIAWPHLPVRTLAILEEQAGPLLLIGGDDGILRPFANAPGWRVLTDWRVRDVLDIKIDPFRPEIIYAATGLGVVASYDGGASWILAGHGLSETFVSCLSPDPLVPGRILAGTESGIFESKDYGASWRLLALGRIAIRAVLRQRFSPGVYWVGTEYRGLLVSHDGGYVFTPVPLGVDTLSIYCVAGGNIGEPLVAGTFERGLFVAPAENMMWRHMTGSEQLGTVFTIALFALGQRLYVGTHGDGVWRSADAGTTWEAFGLPGADVRKLLAATFAKLP